MAAKVVFALFFSLVIFSQVYSSSDLKKNEETSHVPMRGSSDRKLMHNLVLDVSKYVKDRLVFPRALALAPAPSPSPNQLDCDGLCTNRCSLHSRQNICLRACGTCCVRCKCVPPGTSGNREVCGKCYTEMTTHQNKTKCP